MMETPGKILLVEDENIIAAMQRRDLESCGYSVCHVLSGEEAVTRVVENGEKFSLILMDIDLGDGIDGTEAALRILENIDIPVVFLSSHTEPEVVRKTEKITSYGYVVKDSGIVVLDTSIKMAFKLFNARISELEKERKLQQALDQENLLGSIVENISESILVTDRDFNIKYANKAFTALFGYSADEIKGRTPDFLNAEPDSMEIQKRIYETVSSGQAFRGISLNITKDSSTFICEYYVTPMTDKNGEISAYIGIQKDITKQKRYEQTMHAKLNELNLIFRISTIVEKPGISLQGILQGIAESIPEFWPIPESSYSRITIDGIVYQTEGFSETGILQHSSVYTNGRYRGKIQVCVNETDNENSIWFIEDEQRLLDSVAERMGRIIERIEQNRKFAETSERLKGILDYSPNIIFQKDMEGRFTLVNREFERIFIPESLILGLTDSDLMPEEYAEQNRNNDLAVLAEGKPMQFEETVRFPDGIHTVLSNKFPVFDSNKEMTGICCISTDITDRKRMETTILRQKLRLDNILSSTDLGIWEWNVMTGETVFNERWAEIIGYTLEEISPVSIKTWEYYIHPDDLEKSGNELNRHFSGETDYYQCESRMKHRDGSYVWVLDHGKVITRTDDGRPLLMIGTHQDITDRKRSEIAVKESELKLRNILENSNNIFYIHGTDHVLTYLSPQVRDILGYSPEEAMINWQNLASDNPINEKGIIITEKAIMTGKRQPPYELELLRKDGVPVNIEIREFPLVENGKTVAIYGSVIDITEQKRNDLMIRSQLREKEILLKEVYHRIKNNVLSIENMLKLRISTVKDPESALALQDTISAIESIVVLYDKLLQTGEYRDLPADEYLHELICSIRKTLITDTRLTITEEIDSVVLNTRVLYPVGLIVSELLTNAIKYAFLNDAYGTIRISFKKSGDQIKLSVDDNGSGMPDNFDLENSSGFGLTIVKMLSQQIGGSFSINSSGGTNSSVVFPAGC